MYQILHQNLIIIVEHTEIALRSLKKRSGRGKNLGSVGIPEHNYLFFGLTSFFGLVGGVPFVCFSARFQVPHEFGPVDAAYGDFRRPDEHAVVRSTREVSRTVDHPVVLSLAGPQLNAQPDPLRKLHRTHKPDNTWNCEGLRVICSVTKVFSIKKALSLPVYYLLYGQIFIFVVLFNYLLDP